MTNARAMRRAAEEALKDPEYERKKLYVVPRHSAWLEMPEDQQIYSEEALDVGMQILRRQMKYERSGRYSPSSLGECQRRLAFGYHGAPQDPINLDSLDLMSMGTRDHFWWQLEALTMGWMKEAEAWRHRPDLRLGGSLDGILADDSVFELKTMRTNLFSKWALNEGRPKREHLLQVHAYFILSELEWASLVYQERETGAYHEFRIKRDEALIDEVHALLEQLDGYIDADTLPEILDDCEMRQGTVYRQCPYRTHCLAVHRKGR